MKKAGSTFRPRLASHRQSAAAAMAASKTKVTMLSGFLGAGGCAKACQLGPCMAHLLLRVQSRPAGKTTLLRYVLENSKEKIACIVNDVASINIDAKLVRNDRNRARGEQVNTTADLADTIELQNGCACASREDRPHWWGYHACAPSASTAHLKHARPVQLPFSCRLHPSG